MTHRDRGWVVKPTFLVTKLIPNRPQCPCVMFDTQSRRTVCYDAPMHVVIFEGTQWPSFAPLCLNRPVFMLSTGMSTLFEKQLRHLEPTRLTLWVRPDLADSVRTRVLSKMKIPAAVNEPLDDEPALLVSGRSLHFRKFERPPEPCA